MGTPLSLLATTPADGTAILPTASVSFDIRCAAAILRITITAEFPGLRFREVVYDGKPSVDLAAGFEDIYAERSSIAVVVDPGFERYHLSIARSPAWPASPTLTAIGYSDDGGEL